MRKSNAVSLVFRNVERHNGAEAYRCIVEPILARREDRRAEFEDKMMKPKKAGKVTDIFGSIDQWESDYRQFLENGGKHIDDETPRNLMVCMLPADCHIHVSLHLGAHKTHQELRDFLKQYVRTSLKVQGAKQPMYAVEDNATAE